MITKAERDAGEAKRREAPMKLHSTGLVVDWNRFEEMWQISGLEPEVFFAAYDYKINTYTKAKISSFKKKFKKRSTPPQTKPTTKRVPRNEKQIWQMFQDWREGQGKSDWTVGDAIKTHITLLLSDAVVKDKDTGLTHSTLKAGELSSIANAVVAIQKIQRLALGMSTDNHGLVEPPDPNVEKSKIDSPAYPTFVVEVNKSGKFHRSRPRQIA